MVEEAILLIHKRLWIKIFVYSIVLIHVASGVRILEVKVPSRVKVDETVELSCIFDLEKKSLYSLNWWKGNQQFYLFAPVEDALPKKTIYDSPGINVDNSLSGLNSVVLRNVSRLTSGQFKCEVVAEFPSYERDSKSAAMEVVEVPHRPPVLSLRRLHYNVGEFLEANCSSPGIKPSSKLVWFINGEKISDQHSRMVMSSYHTNQPITWLHEGSDESPGGYHVGDMDDLHIMRKDELPLAPITSNLKIVLRKDHFIDEGRATLACVAALPGLYYKSTDVQVTLPGVVPVTSSHRVSKGGNLEIPNFLIFVLPFRLFVCRKFLFIASIELF